MSRVERLLNLTSALLYTNRALRADEIQLTIPGYPEERLAFRRQFERDKEALRQLGLPLVTEELPSSAADRESSVGYRIHKDQYFLRDPGLSPEELSALHLAAQAVRYGDDPATSGLWKLGLANEEGSRRTVETAASLPSAGPLALLFDSISRKQPIEFVYRGERRVVVGRKLAFRNGHWYLTAYDTARLDDRSFRVDRMDEPVGFVSIAIDLPEARADREPAGANTAPTNPFDAPWELGDHEPTTTLVRIDKPHASWAEERLGSGAVVSTDEHGATFSLQVRNVDALLSFVLGFLDHAEILEPRSYRSALVEWVTSGVGSES